VTGETCKRSKWDGSRSQPCGRPVKEDGLCGIHLGAERRKANNAEKRKVDQADTLRRGQALADRLARHGIEVRVSQWNETGVSQPSMAAIADMLDAKYGGAA
jgi:hypothetical protein